jgi:glycosyltransferase involved in cell wall biosynthesis
VRCPSLAELPRPPFGKSGWPWTEESSRPPEPHAGESPRPRITVVTPSFNQGQFLEETIRSILLQGYPNLEYFVLDGGSSDQSVEIIEKYAPWIDFWVSERDRGQSAAINRGLRMGSGSYATWINSDDMLCKDALVVHSSTHEMADDVVYVGDCINIDAAGQVLFKHRGRVRSLEDLLRVRSVWQSGGFICQQEVLFPLQLALRVGGLNEDNHYSMDYELWGRFFLAGARVQYTGIPFGFFRRHEAQKTKAIRAQTESMFDVAEALLARAGSVSAPEREDIRAELTAYREAYPELAWRHTGRLARLGLPPSIVTPIRTIKEKVEKSISDLTRSAK